MSQVRQILKVTLFHVLKGGALKTYSFHVVNVAEKELISFGKPAGKKGAFSRAIAQLKSSRKCVV